MPRQTPVKSEAEPATNSKQARKVPLRLRPIQVVAGQIFTGARILRLARLRHGWSIYAVTDQGRIKFPTPALVDERIAAEDLATITIEDGVAVLRSACFIPRPPLPAAQVPGYQPGNAIATTWPPDTPATRWAMEVLPEGQRPGLSASALADACFAKIRAQMRILEAFDADRLAAQTATKTPPENAAQRASVLRYQARDARFVSSPWLGFIKALVAKLGGASNQTCDARLRPSAACRHLLKGGVAGGAKMPSWPASGAHRASPVWPAAVTPRSAEVAA